MAVVRRIAAHKVTAADRTGEPIAADSGLPKVTSPGYVASQATPGTATTLALADLKAADQHVSLPQLIKPLPTTAPRAIDLDAAIPTSRLITKVVPGPGMMAAALPQRTTPPQEIRVAMIPKTETPGPLGKGYTTVPAFSELAAGIARSPVKDIAIVFDGEALALRTAPETLNGIATGPLRELFEHTDGVLYWFPITKEVRAINADSDLHLTIGNPDIDINGSTERVALAPYIKQGRTMLSLQFIADMLDVTISYEPTTQQIVISSNQF